MEKKKKTRIRTPLLLFCILMGVTLVLCTTAFGLWFHGRQALTANVTAPNLPDQDADPETSTEPETVETAPEAQTEVLERFTLRYNGKEYQYNEDMCNILLLGIDADAKPEEPLPYGSDIQADVLVLAALDLKNNNMTLLSISRDTMCDIEILDETGESLGFSNSQLALSYAYGDGLARSCELTCEAVSNLFYGLQIHGYGAFYLGGIAALNDTLGGVTVTVLDDFPFTAMGSAYSNMYAGQSVTLTGQQARAYIQLRLDDETGNTLRMQRQKQYMLAMVSQALAAIKENPAKVFSIYSAVDDYILTDLDLSRISYLATNATSMAFNGEIRSLEGTLTLGAGNHMELVLDQDTLYETILDVFYEEVTE